MLLSELPADILIALFCICEIKDVLRLEQTCRKLRDLVSTHQVWLAHLRRLDQPQAPDLPFHVNVYTLKSEELRSLVIRAVRADENCRNGVFGENARVLSIELDDPPAVDFLPPGTEVKIRNSYGIPDVVLIPGGDYCFVQWTHGFVQLVDTKSQRAVWTYPELPLTERAPTIEIENHLCFDVEFQDNGLITVVASRYDIKDNVPGQYELVIEVTLIDVEEQGAKRLYSKRIEDVPYPGTLSTSIEGGLISHQCNLGGYEPDGPSLLTVIDYVSNQVVFAETPYNYRYPRTKIIRGHLFLSCCAYNDPGTPLLRVLDVRNLLTVVNEGRQTSSAVARMNIDELGFTDIYFELPHGYYFNGPVKLPSLCSFHWKETWERFDLLIIEIAAREESCTGSFLNRYYFTPRKSHENPPKLTLISSSKIFPPPDFDSQLFSSGYMRCSISGRQLKHFSAYPGGAALPDESVLITVDGSSVNSNRLPKRLTETRTCYRDLDPLSGAIIGTGLGQRRISITYPA